MPKLNRRIFLQMTGAAGLMPVLPASRIAAAPKVATHAQMMWASLYARAGNVKSAADVARTMGVSGAAARGIFSKLAAANLLSAPGAHMLGHMTTSPSKAGVVKSKASKLELRDMLRNALEEDEPEALEDEDSSEEE